MAEKTWHELAAPERRRTYVFADGARVDYLMVTRVCVSGSGTHYLETANGMKYIVAPGWRAIELDMDAWTF